jgi:hypothetical protein
VKIAGQYEELWPAAAGEGEGPLAAAVRQEAVADEEALVGYLRDGVELFTAMGAVGDLLGSGERILGGESVLTDGEWVWRGDLWFYVRRYHLALPGEFLAAVRGRGHRVPEVERPVLLALWEALRPLL